MKNASIHMHISIDTEEVHDLLRAGALRRTRERVQVLATLMRLHTPCTVEMLVHELGKAVNKVTLYRMLERFADAGIVERVVQHDGVRRYEYQREHHHHITCTECGARGRVLVPEQTLARAARGVEGFAVVTAHTLEFYGRCEGCNTQALQDQ